MKYDIHVNQQQLRELGIRNVNQAHILDLLTSVSSWATEIIIDGKVYYWVARQKIADELWILNLKPDTIYRHLKKLVEYGLIDYIKQGKKDCIRLTEKGKKYHSGHYVGNESEKGLNSEMNPKKLGNESENNSDLNPTYNTTKYNHTTKESLSDNPLYKKLSTEESILYMEYIELRKKMKVQTTIKIHERLLKKYFKFGRDLSVIENAITANWKDFYQLRDGDNKPKPKKKNFTDDSRLEII